MGLEIWIWSVTRRKIKGDAKAQKIELPFWRRKLLWKEEIQREESKSDFGYGEFEISIEYPDETIKQLFGYTIQKIWGEAEARCINLEIIRVWGG